MAQRKTSTRSTRSSTSTAKRKGTSRSGNSRSRSATKTMTQKRRAQLNIRWGFSLLFVAVLAFLALFKVEGIQWLGKLVSGAIGTGFLVLPFCLILAAYLLFASRGRPIKKRVSCALLIPYLIGAIAHALVGPRKYIWEDMIECGVNLRGGGVLAGYPITWVVSWLSAIGTVILLFAILVFVALAAFNTTIVAAFDALMELFSGINKKVEYEEEPEEDEEIKREQKEEKKASEIFRKKRKIIDIPLDESPEDEKNDDEAKEEKDANGFVLAPSKVKTPADALNEQYGDKTEEPPTDEVAPEAEERINDENFAADILKAIEESEKDEEAKRNEAIAANDGFAVPNTTGEAVNKEIYSYPPLSLLNPPPPEQKVSASAELQSVGMKLRDTIHSFGIDIKVVNIVRGPAVTRFEVKLDVGVKLSRITNLSEDIALALGVGGVFISPVAGKSLIGIEVPNKTVQMVSISEVIASEEFAKNESDVAFALGKDISGKCIICDIAKLPHMLIAGTTGSGKSVCINSIIISLLYRSSPEQVRLIMVDPKMVELGVYNGIPHLLVPVVTDPKKAAGALQWAVVEMMRRYELFAKLGVRNMEAYNKAIAKTGEAEPLPSIVIVIDELSDLMVVARKDVEASILRLTQMARAAGMHLIIATQRPSADVITGVIKSNVPSRIAFAVASKIESNIILGRSGAEALIGKGDMMYEPIGAGKSTRVQGCFISSDEVEEVVNFVKKNSKAEYSQEIIDQIEKQAEKNEGAAGNACDDDEDADEMLYAAIDVVVESGQASTSMLQRRLKLGYSRAARIIDQMEERGIVGEFEGSKPRKILITRDEWNEMKMRREEM